MTWAPPAVAAPARTGWNVATIIATAGAALLLLGSFLPWASIDTFIGDITINGIDGDGKITAIIAIVAVTLLATGASTRQRALLLIGAILAALGAAVAGYDLLNITRVAADLEDDTLHATTGVGLYVCVAGGLAGFIAGMIAQSDLS